MIELPEEVRRKLTHLGDEGLRWSSGLPTVVGELERKWSISVGEALGGGSAAFVARARIADGRDAVLKVMIPGEDHVGQQRVLAGAEGRGYVRLFEWDLERRAMLLEALGPPMSELDLTPERAIEVLCRTLRRAWRKPGSGEGVSGEGKAEQLGRMVGRLWERLDRPCPEPVVAFALRCARRRAAFDGSRRVVVHGDPHAGNALRVCEPRPGAESGFVFVDPDGFVADPAYDLGVVLRDWCSELLASDDPLALARYYCRMLATESGLDEAAVWEWGYLERVSTGLYLLELGAEDLARPFLLTAEMLAGVAQQ